MKGLGENVHADVPQTNCSATIGRTSGNSVWKMSIFFAAQLIFGKYVLFASVIELNVRSHLSLLVLHTTFDKTLFTYCCVVITVQTTQCS